MSDYKQCKECIKQDTCTFKILKSKEIDCQYFYDKDVMSRSEIEKIQKSNDKAYDNLRSLYKEAIKEHSNQVAELIIKLDQTEQNVTKQIFEEAITQIENAMDSATQSYKVNKKSLYFQAKFVGLNQARCILLDLKKKHMGE